MTDVPRPHTPITDDLFGAAALLAIFVAALLLARLVAAAVIAAGTVFTG